MSGVWVSRMLKIHRLLLNNHCHQDDTKQETGAINSLIAIDLSQLINDQ